MSDSDLEASYSPVSPAVASSSRLVGPTEEESTLEEQLRDCQCMLGSRERELKDLEVEVDKLKTRQETDRSALMEACLGDQTQRQVNEALTKINTDLRKRLAAAPQHDKLREDNRVLAVKIATLEGCHAETVSLMGRQVKDLQSIIQHFRDGVNAQHQKMQQERDNQLVEIGRLQGLLNSRQGPPQRHPQRRGRQFTVGVRGGGVRGERSVRQRVSSPSMDLS